MKNIVHLINVSKKPYFRSAAHLMTEIFTISRLKYKPDLLPLTSVCPLPEIPGHFNLNFEEVALKRGENLWKTNSIDNQVNLLWSGGIDSTTALTSLILNRPANGEINVYCNLNSILENADFYKLLLKHEFINLKNSSVISPSQGLDMITGELGDQVFGSDLIYAISNIFGFDSVFESYEKIIPELFVKRCGEQFGRTHYEKYAPIVNEAPFKLETAYDFVWWWNFTQKWQCIKFHQKSLLDQNVNPVHFYEDTDFQLWSLFNHPKKISKTLNSYKMPSKEFIFNFDKNSSYLETKKKYASPLGNKRYFYALFDDGTFISDYDECNQLIDRLAPLVTY